MEGELVYGATAVPPRLLPISLFDKYNALLNKSFYNLLGCKYTTNTSMIAIIAVLQNIGIPCSIQQRYEILNDNSVYTLEEYKMYS